MAQEIADLINVRFVDQTSFTPEAGEDVIGLPIEHCWGEVNTLRRYNIKTFLNTFPEAHPVGGPSNASISYLNAWAQARRAFKAGASTVEIIRAQGNWKYHQMNITADATPPTAVVHVASSTKFATTGCDVSLAMRYPGRPARTGEYASFVGFKFTVVLKVSVDLAPGSDPEPQITVQVWGVSKGGVYTSLEIHEGDFNLESVVDGQSYHISKVLERDSKLVDIAILNIPNVATNDQTFEYETEVLAIPTAITASEYTTIINNTFADTERSLSTILLAPINGNNTLNAAIAAIVTGRKECNFIVGMPTSTVLSEANIESFITSGLPAASFDMFTLFIAAKEVFSVCGQTLYMDCTAGYAGAVARIANTVKINQMPSARTYGSFDGTLVESLNFDAVLRLHKLGVNSIYTSSTGAQIFGIRSRHAKQTSYFAKSNISRTTARFLKTVFPVVLEVIHTETVSDPTNLAQLDSTLSRAVDSFISKGNLGTASVVDLSNNDDTESNGGEILNINFNLAFKKLTEKVNIQIIATDSSITTNIT